MPSDRNDQPIIDVGVRVSISIFIPAGKRKETLGIFALMIKRIKNKEGCLICRLYQDAISEHWLMYEETWANQKAFQKHLYSYELRTALLVVEMAAEPPEIRFERIARFTGIEAIEEFRKGADAPSTKKDLLVC